MKILLFSYCTCCALTGVSQTVTNLVSATNIGNEIRNEPDTRYKVVRRNDTLFLKVITASTTTTPSTYLAKSRVIPGQVYTYIMSGIPCTQNKAALYITSPGGNIGWPATMVEKGIVRQVFTVPQGVTEVSLAVSFMYPREGECVYIYDIGLFKGDVSASAWQTSEKLGLREFINKEWANFPEGEETGPFSADTKSTLPPNLFSMNDLGEIKRENQAQIYTYEQKGEGFLKIVCYPTTLTPSVYFKTLKVEPGKPYSFLIDARPTAGVKVYFYVNSPATHVVWPGLKLVNGRNKQSFTVPEGVNEVTLGVSFINPNPEEFILIKDIGFYQGEIDTTAWNGSEKEGLRPLLKPSYKPWLWFAFPLSLMVLVVLYFRDRRVADRTT